MGQPRARFWRRLRPAAEMIIPTARRRTGGRAETVDGRKAPIPADRGVTIEALESTLSSPLRLTGSVTRQPALRRPSTRWT